MPNIKKINLNNEHSRKVAGNSDEAFENGLY